MNRRRFITTTSVAGLAIPFCILRSSMADDFRIIAPDEVKHPDLWAVVYHYDKGYSREIIVWCYNESPKLGQLVRVRGVVYTVIETTAAVPRLLSISERILLDRPLETPLTPDDRFIT